MFTCRGRKSVLVEEVTEYYKNRESTIKTRGGRRIMKRGGGRTRGGIQSRGSVTEERSTSQENKEN